MHHTGKPILIFAQSGRFLAQSATQAGYRVWVADCFGDQDTLNISERWQALPAFSELRAEHIIPLLNQLTNGEDCSFLFGTGIEKYYSIISHLPSNISYIGNNENTLNLIKTPELFFNLLSTLTLPFPKTIFTHPRDTKPYIAKSKSGFGGSHIKAITEKIKCEEYYFQQYIRGQAGSALFIADGEQSQLLSVNKQKISENDTSFFCLSSIETPFTIESIHKNTLIDAIKKLTSHTGLVGVNSLDFIISDNNALFILEINPRFSASAELFHDSPRLFHHHLLACTKKELKALPALTKPFTSLYYLFSSYDISVPDDMVWPQQCNDIPCPGTQIKKQSPICTVKLNTVSEGGANKQFEKIKESINTQLNTLN